MKVFTIQFCVALCLAILGMGIALGVTAMVSLGLEWSGAASETAWYAYAALAFFWFVVLIAALSRWFSQWRFSLDIRITEVDPRDTEAADPPATTAVRR